MDYSKHVIRIGKILIAILFMQIFTSCATLLSKSIYEFQITSEPPNLKIRVLDKYNKEILVSNTPDTIMLKADAGYFKKADYIIIVECDSSNLLKQPLNFIIDNNYYLNIPTMNLLGLFIIDPLTGAMWKPSVGSMHFDFRQK